jgi:hypothetical protein
LSDGILLLLLNLGVIVALANVNPCMRVDENLSEGKVLSHDRRNKVDEEELTIIVSRHAARKLAISIKTSPRRPTSQSPRAPTK